MPIGSGEMAFVGGEGLRRVSLRLTLERNVIGIALLLFRIGRFEVVV